VLGPDGAVWHSAFVAGHVPPVVVSAGLVDLCPGDGRGGRRPSRGWAAGGSNGQNVVA
jgi:hypothetical protein